MARLVISDFLVTLSWMFREFLSPGLLSFSDCTGPLKPEVVWHTQINNIYPATSVLVRHEQDGYQVGTSGAASYWITKSKNPIGQGIKIKLDNCPRWITGCQIQNTGKGTKSPPASTWVSTREFNISGSLSENGPWKTLVQAEFDNMENNINPALQNFTFDQPEQIQYLKFEPISKWGSHYAALQYLAAIPAAPHKGNEQQYVIKNSKRLKLSVGCNVTAWSEWSFCCGGKSQRNRTMFQDGECQSLTGVRTCPEDNCPGDCQFF